MVGNKIAEVAGGVLKTNGTYVDVTALTNATFRELFFNKGAVILNISKGI